MRGLVILALLAGAFFLMRNEGGLDAFGLGGSLVSGSGSEVVLEAGDLQARFRRGATFDDAFMIFGGLAQSHPNALQHATLAALPLRDARRIAARHPDFHRCASPGAAEAKRLVRDLSFVAATPAARRALGEALRAHEAAIRRGGDRVCVTVSGAELALGDVSLARDGTDLTSEIRPHFAGTAFHLAEEAELASCRELLAAR